MIGTVPQAWGERTRRCTEAGPFSANIAAPGRFSKLSPSLCVSPVVVPLTFPRVPSAFWPPVPDRVAHFHPHPAWLPSRLCILHIASTGRRSEGSGSLSKIPTPLAPCPCCKRHNEAHILTGASRSSSHMNSNDCNY